MISEQRNSKNNNWYDKLAITFWKFIYFATPKWFTLLSWIIILSVFITLRNVYQYSFMGILIEIIIIISGFLLLFYMFFQFFYSLLDVFDKIKKSVVGIITGIIVVIINTSLFLLALKISELLSKLAFVTE